VWEGPMSGELGLFTVPWSQRTFAGMYAMVEQSFAGHSGPFVCCVQCIDDGYTHESDVKGDMTFKISGSKTEHSVELIRDMLWGTRRSSSEPLSTYGCMCLWERDRGQCYAAVSECSHMTEHMMHAWHFPFVDDEPVYGDSIVFVRAG